MEEKKYNSSKLYMPSNISSEKNIFTGIGNKEMKWLGILTFISIVIGIIITIITNFQLGLILTFISILFSYFLCTKIPDTNTSTLEGMIGVYRYFTKKNLYKYKYTEWWEKYD